MAVSTCERLTAMEARLIPMVGCEGVREFMLSRESPQVIGRSESSFQYQ